MITVRRRRPRVRRDEQRSRVAGVSSGTSPDSSTRCPACREQRRRLQQRVAGAKLRFLHDELQVAGYRRSEARTSSAPWPDDQRDAGAASSERRSQTPLDERQAG